jgi:hypothetical protein
MNREHRSLGFPVQSAGTFWMRALIKISDHINANESLCSKAFPHRDKLDITSNLSGFRFDFQS